MIKIHPQKWLAIKKAGLYCIPGDFYIDPIYPVNKAIITHAHGDHARSGHQHVIASSATIQIMKTRYGEECSNYFQPVPFFERVKIQDVECYLLPSGHILGSAQIVL